MSTLKAGECCGFMSGLRFLPMYLAKVANPAGKLNPA
jgi:hypothetical protein